MKACVWFGVVLCMLGLSAAQATVTGAAKLGDDVRVSGDESRDGVGPKDYYVNDYSANLSELVYRDGLDASGICAVSPPALSTAALAANSPLVSAVCREGLHFAVLRDAPISVGDHSTRTAPAYGTAARSGAMTALDLALMVLFAAGLLAYQLDRKQRVLRQSSLFAASLSG